VRGCTLDPVAAARDAPVVRDCAVGRVVTALGETVIDMETGIELVRVGERLLDVADTVPIGPGTYAISDGIDLLIQWGRAIDAVRLGSWRIGVGPGRSVKCRDAAI